MIDDPVGDSSQGSDKGNLFGSELPFRRLIEKLPACAYTCDAQGLITYFNRQAVELWGREPKLNNPVDRFCGSFRLFASDGAPIAHDQCWMAEALATGRDIDGREVTIERPDGTRRTVLAHVSTFRDDAGQLLGAVNVLVDISDRKRTEEAQARLAAIVESSQDAIISQSLDGRILSWNAGAERLFGYSPAEAVGRPITIICPPDRQLETQNLLVRTGRGERVNHLETERIDKNGHRIDVSLTVSPVCGASGQIVGASVVARDITARTLAERIQRESEERFERFMQHLPGLAWIKDLQGRYVFINDAAQRAFGRLRDDLYGKTDEEIFPPDTAAQFQANDQQALSSGTRIETVETLEHEDGVHHSLVTKFPIPGPGGSPSLIGGMAIDVTEGIKAERAMRESEARFRNMADNVPVLIWMNDEQGCNFVNREYLRFVGCEFEDVQGLKWRRFLHPEDEQQYVSIFRQATHERRPFEAQHRFRRFDGEYRWLRSSGVPRLAEDGTLLGFVGCSADITEIKRSETALQEADRRKDEFLAMLAHELRNPLAPISNSLHLLRMLDDLSPAAERVVEIMEQEVRQMVRLVDDLLEVSRITRGKIALRKEMIELAAVVRSAVETSRPLIDTAGHQLAVSIPVEPMTLEGDPVRLAQVIANLLNNAAKYTPQGGQIWLTVRRQETHATIAVRDSGAGIPAELLPRVFDMFAQLDHTLERSQGGLGIGLALARELVQLHGGNVEVHSDGPGTGSEFVVHLPICARPALPGTTKSERPKPVQFPPHRVLVVDDERGSAYVLGKLLEKMGQHVRTAHDARSALEQAGVEAPDLVISDISMPDMDGYELARRLRQMPRLEATLLVALTGYGQDSDRARAKDAGFDRHLTKPATIEALKGLLASLRSA